MHRKNNHIHSLAAYGIIGDTPVQREELQNITSITQLDLSHIDISSFDQIVLH
jgi:hypothetical protein